MIYDISLHDLSFFIPPRYNYEYYLSLYFINTYIIIYTCKSARTDMRENSMEEELKAELCSSYEYNFYNEKAFCYFMERYLTKSDTCPCEFYNIVEISQNGI